jgi:Integrase core domain
VASFTATATATAYGLPASTLTDNPAVYTSRFTQGHNDFERLLATLGITQKNGHPNHPQTQGKIERFLQTLKRWLAAQPRPSTLAELQTLLDTFGEHLQHPASPPRPNHLAPPPVRRPGGCGGSVPGAGGGSDLIGEFRDEFGALLQVGRPGRVGGEHVGDGGQPAQRSAVCRVGAAGGREAAVQDGGGVVGVAERGVGGLVQGRDGVVSFDGQQGEVAAQHGPGLGVGEVVT